MSSDNALELNLTPHDLLSEQDMIELTGVTRPDLQARVLAANNIYFLVNGNRVPKTTWFHVNNPIHLRTPTLSLSDFGYGFTKSFQLKRDQATGTPSDLKKLEDRILGFFRRVRNGLDKEIPEHIKQQIEQNKAHLDNMSRVAKQQRKLREEEEGY